MIAFDPIQSTCSPERSDGLSPLPLSPFSFLTHLENNIPFLCSGDTYLSLTVDTLDENLRVLDVDWNQTAGGELTCVETEYEFSFSVVLFKICCLFIFFSRERNCGGDGNMFLYFPQQNVEPCILYSWTVTVYVGDDTPLFSSTLDICDMEFLAPPEGLIVIQIIIFQIIYLFPFSQSPFF